MKKFFSLLVSNCRESLAWQSSDEPDLYKNWLISVASPDFMDFITRFVNSIGFESSDIIRVTTKEELKDLSNKTCYYPYLSSRWLVYLDASVFEDDSEFFNYVSKPSINQMTVFYTTSYFIFSRYSKKIKDSKKLKDSKELKDSTVCQSFYLNRFTYLSDVAFLHNYMLAAAKGEPLFPEFRPDLDALDEVRRIETLAEHQAEQEPSIFLDSSPVDLSIYQELLNHNELAELSVNDVFYADTNESTDLSSEVDSSDDYISEVPQKTLKFLYYNYRTCILKVVTFFDAYFKGNHLVKEADIVKFLGVGDFSHVDLFNILLNLSSKDLNTPKKQKNAILKVYNGFSLLMQKYPLDKIYRYFIGFLDGLIYLKSVYMAGSDIADFYQSKAFKELRSSNEILYYSLSAIRVKAAEWIKAYSLTFLFDFYKKLLTFEADFNNTDSSRTLYLMLISVRLVDLLKRGGCDAG